MSKITGATAAAPAIAKVLGSVTPAMYRARAAAKNDLRFSILGQKRNSSESKKAIHLQLL